MPPEVGQAPMAMTSARGPRVVGFLQRQLRLLRPGMSAPTLHRGVCFVRCGQKHETLGIEGRAEVRTLRFLAAMVFEKLELLASVDAVRGDANAEPAAHADDGGDDRRIGFLGSDVRPKSTIHFYGLDWARA